MQQIYLHWLQASLGVIGPILKLAMHIAPTA